MLQTFLEQNEGPGLQHLALKTDNIFSTMRQLRARSSQGGFDFMPCASDSYYECARNASATTDCCLALQIAQAHTFASLLNMAIFI